MSVYSTIPLRRPKRSRFNLSHEVDTAFNIGQLVPTCRPVECVPGDTFKLAQVASVDLMPLVRPFKGDLYFESWAFFVTNDMLMQNRGLSPINHLSFTDLLVNASDPKSVTTLPGLTGINSNTVNFQPGKLPDYLGYPVGIGNSLSGQKWCDFPIRGVNLIWNEYFRDENLQTERVQGEGALSAEYFSVPKVNYKKDRFTSAFRTEQKGNPITIGIASSAPVSITTQFLKDGVYSDGSFIATGVKSDINSFNVDFQTQYGEMTGQIPYADIKFTGEVDLSQASSITINDLRLANKLQLWQERNQLAGSRPKEYLLANYGIAPNDETLQRPVLIGHTKTPVIINTVMQNIETDTVTAGSGTGGKASKGGNGVTTQSTYFGKWTCKEFGWIIVLSALRPKANYTQGIHRSLIKNTVYDFFNPIFQNLGQQEIFNSEVFVQNTSDDKEIFGFTDRYNEYRHLESMTTGILRNTVDGSLSSWIMNRKFAELPTLDSNFITVEASEYDYLFNFQSSFQTPQAIIQANNIITAIRPLSKYAHPSLGV